MIKKSVLILMSALIISVIICAGCINYNSIIGGYHHDYANGAYSDLEISDDNTMTIAFYDEYGKLIGNITTLPWEYEYPDNTTIISIGANSQETGVYLVDEQALVILPKNGTYSIYNRVW